MARSRREGMTTFVPATAMSSRGFTLLELLVALAILTGALVVTLPSLTAGSGVELRAAARTVATALRRTRDRAITRNASEVLTLDLERREMTFAGSPRPRELPSGIEIRLFAARSELIGESHGAIRFFPDGSSTGGRVTLSNDALRYLVDVDWLTGRVRIFEASAETEIEPPAPQLQALR